MNTNSTIPANRQTALGNQHVLSASWMICLCWSLLIIASSKYGDLIPKVSILRVIVPASLLGIFFYFKNRTVTALESRIDLLLIFFFGAGLVSTLLCVAPTIAGLKLLFYAGIIIPLLRCHWILDSFRPASDGWWLLARLVLLLILVNLALMPVSYGMGIFKNPNELGQMSVVSCGILLTVLGISNKKRRGYIYAGIIISIVFCSMSRSRGSAVALLSTFVVYYGLRWSASWVAIILTGIFAVVCGLAVLFISNDAQEFVDKDGKGSLIDNTRQQMALETLEAFTKRPIWGYGFGLSHLIKPEHVEEIMRTGRLSWYVGEFGNSTLAMLSGGGLSLAISFYAILSMIFISGMYSLRTTCRQGSHHDVQIGSLALFSGLLANSQSEAWLMSPLNWPTMLFWLVAGSIIRVATTAHIDRQRCATRNARFSRPRLNRTPR